MPRRPAVLPALSLALLLAGCLGPSWYAGGIAATADLTGPWDLETAREALAAQGFTLRGESAYAERGKETLRAGAAPEGMIELWYERSLGERVWSEDAAVARVQELRAEVEPAALALFASVENATGWQRVGAIAWHENVLHGD